MEFDIVVPTIGRDSLRELLQSLARARGPLPQRVIVVDDRQLPDPPLSLDIDEPLKSRISVLNGNAWGPASARNIGWRAAKAAFVAFLDDDVIVDTDWLERLAGDIHTLGPEDAGCQGRVGVPLPQDRPPTDWERNVAGLQHSSWITADMVYRREVLEQLGGFDERFRRAYREDADFALQVFNAGYRLVRGSRGVAHPVRPADSWVSVRLQAGNADDVLMTAKHGRDWRERARAPQGRWPYHLATVVCFAAWAGLTADFAWKRIAPGPRTAREIRTMILTSAVIPFAAVYHTMRGAIALARLRRAQS